LLEIIPKHVHLFVECDPTFSISKITNRLKGYTSRVLRALRCSRLRSDQVRKFVERIQEHRVVQMAVGAADRGALVSDNLLGDKIRSAGRFKERRCSMSQAMKTQTGYLTSRITTFAPAELRGAANGCSLIKATGLTPMITLAG
jgi:hypothetical protein